VVYGHSFPALQAAALVVGVCIQTKYAYRHEDKEKSSQIMSSRRFDGRKIRSFSKRQKCLEARKLDLFDSLMGREKRTSARKEPEREAVYTKPKLKITPSILECKH